MNEDTTDAVSEDWREFHVAERGCQLHHPPGWTVVTNVFGALVAAIAPPRGDGAFLTNVNVVLHDGEPMTPQECVAAQIAGLEATLEGVIVFESEPATIGERSGARALAAHRDGDLELTLEQWMLPVETGTLVVSATALTSDFQHDAAALRAIAASVRLDD